MQKEIEIIIDNEKDKLSLQEKEIKVTIEIKDKSEGLALVQLFDRLIGLLS